MSRDSALRMASSSFKWSGDFVGKTESYALLIYESSSSRLSLVKVFSLLAFESESSSCLLSLIKYIFSCSF
jgi:hypothetical protein